MRKVVAIAVSAAVGITQVAASPGVTTTDVNFRAGPSAGYESLGVLPSGTPVEIVECDAPKAGWCAVIVEDISGFVSGRYLEELPPPAPEPVVPTDAVSLGEETTDDLVARIALYPDALLAQVLVAATVPLDVVKAGRWVEENVDLALEAREAAAAGEGWDESVAALAAGFPSVIEAMAGDLDWTEALGDAVLADSEAVLAAVQRQRARAQAVGTLESNAAQTVSMVDNEVFIEPANPEIVYVPSYDPETVYVETASSADDSVAGAVAAGVLAFTAGAVIADVFDDDWGGYWYGPPRVDWNDGWFYPRPGFRPPPPPGWRPGWRPDRPDRPDIDIDIGSGNIIGRPGRPGIGDRPAIGDRPGVGDRPGIGDPPDVGDRPGIGDRPDRPGIAGQPDRDVVRDRLTAGSGAPEGAFRPDSGRREAARERIASRKGGGLRPNAGGTAGPQRPQVQPVNAAALQSRLSERSGTRPAIARTGPAAATRPARRPSGERASAFSGQHKGKTAAKRAASRGRSSASPARRQAARAAVHRPAAVRAPARRAAARPSAFQRPRAGGGRQVSAHRARGHHSRRGGGRRGRR